MLQLSIRLFTVSASFGLVIAIVQTLGWAALLISPALAFATLIFSSAEYLGGKRHDRSLHMALTVPGGLH